MERIELINIVARNLVAFQKELEFHNASDLYDINTIAEDILIPLLNYTFDFNLVNANAFFGKNYPAIDLVDPKNRVAFQITSDNSLSKVKSTIEKFIKYELYNSYDKLYFYFLKDGKFNIKSEELTNIISDHFDFDISKNILNNTTILSIIKKIEISRLQNIATYLSSEFGEKSTEIRNQKSRIDRIKINKSEEKIFNNLIELKIPSKIYLAELSIDRDEIIKESWSTDYKLKKSTGERNIVKWTLINKYEHYKNDYHTYNKKLLTFRDLHQNNEILRNVIDLGTIDSFSISDFISSSTDNENILKTLIGYVIKEKLYHKKIDWIAKENIFRYKLHKIEQPRKLSWKKKNLSKKTVVFLIKSKADSHIICYRHLAFKYSVHNYNDQWFISITPTWSFTSNGIRKSRYAANYMSGIKRIENNKSVYFYFRMIAYDLANIDLFTVGAKYLDFGSPNFFLFSPIIYDNYWAPPKIADNTLEQPIENQLEGNLFD